MPLVAAVVAAFALLLPDGGAGAQTRMLHVDPSGGVGTFRTIQSAIDAANGGDTVLVAPATYVENLRFGRASGPGAYAIDCIVRADRGAALTTIRGTVSFIDGNSSSALLDGFTLTEPVGKGGRAITIDHGSSPRVYNNTIVGNSGGGIFVTGASSPDITANRILNNANPTSHGGGIQVVGARCSPNIHANVIQGNTALRGGGIAIDGGHGVISCNTIAWNRAAAGQRGNGIYLHQARRVQVHSNDILYNRDPAGARHASRGGGIWCSAGGYVSIWSNRIHHNAATRFGGAICLASLFHAQNIRCNVTTNYIYNNVADNGGGLCIFNNSTSLVQANLVFFNTANESGGGLYIGDTGPRGGNLHNYASLFIHQNTIARNVATSLYGGGIFVTGSAQPSEPNIVNNFISRNAAAGVVAGAGGGLHVDGLASPYILNNSFEGNTSARAGGGISINASGAAAPTVIANTILWEDTAIWGAEIAVFYNAVAPAVSHCVVMGGYPGRKILDANPRFVNPSVADLRIQIGSPCLGSGRSAPNAFNALVPVDMFNNLRPMPASSRHDIGAHER